MITTAIIDPNNQQQKHRINWEGRYCILSCMQKTLKYLFISDLIINNYNIKLMQKFFSSFMNSDPNFFTDPKSPFATAPERVKKVLLQAKQSKKLKTAAINLDNLGFGLKPTGNNFCSHFQPYSGQFHLCYKCSKRGYSQAQLYYCVDCWEPQKHEGHDHYTISPPRFTNLIFCNCGRIDKFKKQFICSKHSAYDIIKQCVIPQKQGNQFKQTLQSLLQCAIYQQLDEIFLQKILVFLNKINENSILYNRLTFDVIVKNSKFIKDQTIKKFDNQNSFLIVLSKCQSSEKFSKFIVHIGGDLLTRINMVKNVCELYNKIGKQRLKNYFHIGLLIELINMTTIQKLLQQNFVHKLFEIIIQKMPDILKVKLTQKIISTRLKIFKNFNQLNELNLKQLNAKEIQVIFIKIIGLYPSSQDIRKFMKGQQQQSQNPWRSNQQSYSNLQQDIRNANKWILRLIAILIKGDIRRLNKIRQILQQAGIKPQKLQQILHWIVLGSKYLCYLEDDPSRPLYTVALIKLLTQSKNSKQLLERFWKSLLKSQKSKEQSQNDGNSTEISYFVDIFHFVISTLFHSEISLLMEKMRIFRSENGKPAKLESKTEEQTLTNWFRSFLYGRKTISRRQIIELKRDGFLEFKNASKILNQICTYDQDNQIFTFTPSQANINIINQFPLKPTRENYASLYTNTLHFGQQINFNGQLSKDLIQFLFKADNILPVFDKEWQKYLKSKSKDDGKQKYAYLYLFVLVLCDCLTKGQNKQLRQRLQFLRQNRQKLSEYTKDSDQIKMINRLLNIQQVQDKKSEADEKNMQIAQKSEKLQKNPSSKTNAKIQQQQICVQCHKTQKEGKDMVYICSIKKDNTICSAIHGQNNISNTQISTCFHSIHVDCFIKLYKNQNKQFTCPLCQIASNCIVPIQFNKQNKRLNNIFSRAVITTAVINYGIYDVENAFIIIFKHLVESNGLNSLLDVTRYQQRRRLWDRNNKFFLKMMKEIYKNSGDDSREQYLGSINNFVDEINKCPHKQSRLIQQLFTEILKDIATASEISINKKLLIDIRESLVQDEFIIIKEQAQRLIGQNGQLVQISLQPPTQQQRSKPKSSLSFDFKRSPENSNQCIKIFSQNCKVCQQTSQCLCLMCGEMLCSSCKYNHFLSAHNDMTIYLDKFNFRVHCNRKDLTSTDNIYQNQFKVSYDDRYLCNMADDQYLINESKYKKIVDRFLSN